MSEDKLTIKYDGEDREVVMLYNTLLLCADLFKETLGALISSEGDVEDEAIMEKAITGLAFDFKIQRKLFSIFLGKVDGEGQITEYVDLSKVDKDSASDLASWCMGHVIGFFMKFSVSSQKHLEKTTQELEKNLKSGKV